MLRYSLFFFCLTSFAYAEQCQEPLPEAKAEALLGRFEKSFSSVRDLRGKFEQESSLAGTLAEKSSGRFAFKKPGKMRWAYTAPDEQLSISNGDRFWHYEPDIPQVYVGELRGAFQSDLPVAFLLGLGSLKKRFEIKRACQVESDYWFELKPKKSEGELLMFSLRIRGGTLAPAVARIVEFGNNETTIYLSDLRENSGIDDKEFEFDIPKNVDIIEAEKILESS